MSKRLRKPGRVFETAPTQNSQEVTRTGLAVAQTNQADYGQFNQIDVPGPGETGFHVDSGGNVGVGAGTATTGNFTVDSAGDVTAKSVTITQKDTSTVALSIESAGPTFTAALTQWLNSSGVLKTSVGADGHLNVFERLSFAEASAPGTPGSGVVFVYAIDKAGVSSLRAKNDAGVDWELRPTVGAGSDETLAFFFAG